MGWSYSSVKDFTLGTNAESRRNGPPSPCLAGRVVVPARHRFPACESTAKPELCCGNSLVVEVGCVVKKTGLSLSEKSVGTSASVECGFYISPVIARPARMFRKTSRQLYADIRIYAIHRFLNRWVTVPLIMDGFCGWLT